MSGARTWDVSARRVGELCVPSSILTHGGGHEVVWVPVIMWVLQSDDHIVVVDTGTPPPGSPESLVHSASLRRTTAEDPEAVLQAMGIDPASVSMVINTHLHWDHSSNNELFPNASVIIQAAEILASLDPPSGQELSFESPLAGMTPPWVKAAARTRVIHGDQELLPGVDVLLVPGHTPGSQAVLVQTRDRPVLIAGDLVPIEHNIGDSDWIIPGLLSSASHAHDSLRKVQDLNVAVLPAHEAEFFTAAGEPSQMLLRRLRF